MVELQLGDVAAQVCHLELGEETESSDPQHLFQDILQPLIKDAPARRSSASPKTRAVPTPMRHSARQAANQSSVPVAQRVALRLVWDLGLFGTREKMTPKAAEKLLQKFDEPLTDVDIACVSDF